MKHKFVSKTFLLSVLLALFFSVVGTKPAQTAGLYTHTWFVEQAILDLEELDRLDEKTDYSGLVSILERYPGYVNYGTLFPDVTYTTDANWAEEVHDTDEIGAINYNTYVAHMKSNHPNDLKRTDIAQTIYYSEFLDGPDAVLPDFRAALIKEMWVYLRRNPRTVDDERMIAFLFGLIAHQEADVPWHYNSECTDPDFAGFECWLGDQQGGLGYLETDIDMHLYSYSGEDPEHRIEFSYFDTIKQTVLNASQSGGFAGPTCSWLVCEPLEDGELLMETLWGTVTTSWNLGDGVQDKLCARWDLIWVCDRRSGMGAYLGHDQR
jgi:hypothetical protein